MEQYTPILATLNVSKSYGPVQALKNVTLSFEDERIYGLFGRNGAGKTTLMDILTAKIFTDQGQVQCLGKEIFQSPETINQICYMPEKHYFPKNLRVKAILAYAQMAYPNFNVAYSGRLCHDFDLNINQKYGALSRGYQSILRIVIGLASNARITLLDEPVLGLDAVARDHFYSELITSFTDNPRLFVIATHLIEESADLFNEAIIIKNGEIIRQAPIDGLLSNAFYVSGPTSKVNAFIQSRTVISSQVLNNIKTSVVQGKPDELTPISGLNFSSLTMQKLFIHLTSNKNHQEASHA